jgi:hypothetical protein
MRRSTELSLPPQLVFSGVVIQHCVCVYRKFIDKSRKTSKFTKSRMLLKNTDKQEDAVKILGKIVESMRNHLMLLHSQCSM